MRVICFDLWNTLAREGEGPSYADVFVEAGVSRNAIYPFVRDNLMNRCWTERETYTSYTWMVRALEGHFKLRLAIPAFREAVARWRDSNQKATWIPGARECLEELRRRYPDMELVLATNSTYPGLDDAVSALHIYDWHFNLGLASCHQGASKPRKEFFGRIEDTYFRQQKFATGSFSEEVTETIEFVMIGDNEKDDLEVPRQLGWRTILVGKEPDFGAVMRELIR